MFLALVISNVFIYAVLELGNVWPVFYFWLKPSYIMSGILPIFSSDKRFLATSSNKDSVASMLFNISYRTTREPIQSVAYIAATPSWILFLFGTYTESIGEL